MLASFPSVVLGFFGMVIIAPILSNWLSPILSEKLPELLKSTNIPFISTTLADFCYDKLFISSGLNITTAALMLTIRAIPVIASIAEDALTSVPRTYREASYSLGADKWETIWKVVIPASVSGLSVAVILGIGTIIGETMIVLMVAGGAAVVPHWMFDAARPMPAAIAAEMAEAPYRSLHYHALFGVGALLIPHHFCIKSYLRFHIKKISVCKNRGKGMSRNTESIHKPFELVRKKRFNFKQGFFLSLIRAFGFSGALTLFVILFFVAYNGISILSWEFITQPPIEAMTKGGIFPVIVGTILLTAFCMIVVIPIGVTTAIFLSEYSKPGLLLHIWL